MCSISNERSTKQKKSGLSPSLLSGAVGVLALGLFFNSLYVSGVLSLVALRRLVAGILGFFVFLVWFVDYYIGYEFRKCSECVQFIAELGNGMIEQSTDLPKCISDLDKIACPQGLAQMWKDEFQDKERPLKMVLTGVTGYVGRAFLFQLLRDMSLAVEDQEGSDKKKVNHKIFVLARAKARKNLSAADRLKIIRDDPMFAPVQKMWDEVIVAAESGDLQEDRCGMSEETVKILEEAQITHFVHCAADVNFNRPMADSAAINVTPALQLQALAQEWPSCQRFVYCSTAFVNPGTGTPEDPLPEALFSLGEYDPQDLYDSMRGDLKLVLEFKKKNGFPNNYVVTKCVAENLLARHNKGLDLRIVRPAVVGPSMMLPHPGWNGDKPSTISGVFLLWGTRVIRFAQLVRTEVPVVPVDVAACGIIHATIAPTPTTSESGKPSLTINNLIWSHKSPKPFMEGLLMGKEAVQVALAVQHFSAVEAALSWLLLDLASNYNFMFFFLHYVFNLGPLYLLKFVCWVAKSSGINSVLNKLPVTKLFNFSDMLVLYRPYMGRPYHFASSFDVPESCNDHLYTAGLFVATHRFWEKMFPGTIEALSRLQFIPKYRLDLWWALTQPCRSFKNRILGFLATKIVRASFDSVELDFTTMPKVAKVMVELDKTMSEQKHCVVLAPTHRSSTMDYVLAKFVCFFMTGYGFDIPHVAAGDQAEEGKKLSKIKSEYDLNACVAPFLEGSPSPDGRFQQPQTEFLKSLVDSPGGHDYTLIPLSIDYDHVEDSDIKMRDGDIGLFGMLSLFWKVCITKSEQHSLGDVRLSFGVPESFGAASVDSVAMYAQREHRRLTTVSDYQLAAAESHLKIPNASLRSAVEQLGATVHPNTNTKAQKKCDDSNQKIVVVESAAESLRLHMQWIYRFVPYLCESHPKWASWIMSGNLDEVAQMGTVEKTEEIEAVLKVLCAAFTTADALATRAEASLRETNGSSVAIAAADVVKEMNSLNSTTDNSASAFYEAAASFVVTGSS